jgi:hypothetical protein
VAAKGARSNELSTKLREFKQMRRSIPFIACAMTVLLIQSGRAAVTEVENEQEPTRHPYQEGRAFAFASHFPSPRPFGRILIDGSITD